MYYALPDAEKNGLAGISRLPFSMKVLLENLLRFEDERSVTRADIQAIAAWPDEANRGLVEKEIGFRPARVLMQDFTGVPAVVDLAAMRDGMTVLGDDPKKINPLVPVDLVIDHSVIVDAFGSPRAFARNVELEYERNGERYNFLKWGQIAFENFRVVPPGTGICHQVNLEYLAQTVWTNEMVDGATVAYPDTLVGTDSHTTMVNGLACWAGAWAASRPRPPCSASRSRCSSRSHRLQADRRAEGRRHGDRPRAHRHADAAQEGRRRQVRRVLRTGAGAPDAGRPRHDRQHGARVRRHLRLLPDRQGNNRVPHHVGPRSAAHRARRGLRQGAGPVARRKSPDPVFTDTLELDLATVVPSMAGPKRPEGRIALTDVKSGFATALESEYRKPGEGRQARAGRRPRLRHRPRRCRHRRHHELHEHVEPERAHRRGAARALCDRPGLKQKPWVKTSLAPGSQVVAAYLDKSGLQPYLDQIGFNLVGFGCTTCIGNSGPLPDEISHAINENGIVAAAVLSGNRNFEAASRPTCRRTTSPRRRSSSPTRSRAPSPRTSPPSRSGRARTANRST